MQHFRFERLSGGGFFEGSCGYKYFSIVFRSTTLVIKKRPKEGGKEKKGKEKSACRII